MQDDELKPESPNSSDSTPDEKCESCEEYLNGWKRAQADYANLKKEYEKARFSIATDANEQLLDQLLPAIDQFETALQHLPDISGLPDDEKKKIQNWLTGITAVKQMWEQTFKEIGLENVEVDGQFDPAKHEAVGQDEAADKPDHSILKVIQNGWKLKGRILRPAKVIINSINND
jgi:molecular chaperone GrpE